MISGAPGAHTAPVAAWLATTVLRGAPFPDGAPTGPECGRRQVMWLDSLQGYKRLLHCVRSLRTPLGIFWPVEKPDQDFPMLDLTRERSLQLVANVTADKRPSWVIVADVLPKSASAPAVARVWDSMDSVARDVGCAVTFLFDDMAHSGQATAPDRVDIASRMTTIVTIAPSAPHSTDLVLRVSGTDAACPEPVHIRIEEGVPMVVQRTVEVIRSAVDRAGAFLVRSLADGPQPAARLIAVAKSERRISKRSLDRAKRLLGVRSYQLSGRWWWVLT